MMQLNTFPTGRLHEQLASATVVPVGATIPADTETPVRYWSAWRTTTPTSSCSECRGRRAVGRTASWASGAHGVIYRDDVVVRQGIMERRSPHNGELLNAARPQRSPTLAPHQAYRLLQRTRGLLHLRDDPLLRAACTEPPPPEQPLAEFVIPETLLIFDNIAHTLTVVALAFREDGTEPDLLAAAEARVRELLARLHAPIPAQAPRARRRIERPQFVHEPGYYKGMVARIKEYIREGDIIQCVVSQSFVGPAPDDLVRLYRAQRYVNPSPYLFFMKARNCTLIGSSPETMIRLDNRTACLRPIAGTRPRGATEQEDRANADALLQDEKERAEHLMLVDLGRNELGHVALPGTVQVTDLMMVERYSHVMHLVSNITADLEPHCDAFDLFKSAFPAGTLSGAPKIRAMEIIAELEETPRGPYGGAVGYFSFDGNMDFCICIRTAVAEHGRLTIRAGGGIVADSEPEYEYRETVNKAAALSRSIELLQRVQGEV